MITKDAALFRNVNNMTQMAFSFVQQVLQKNQRCLLGLEEHSAIGSVVIFFISFVIMNENI